MISISAKFRKLLNHNPLARNALWMSLGQTLRLLIQALYFTVIVRSLGITQYGSFVGVVALVGILSPFGSLGCGPLLVKNVARDRTFFPGAWGITHFTLAMSSAALIAFTLAVSHFVLPPAIPQKLVVLVALADILGTNLISVTGQAFQAFERLEWTAAINTGISVARLLGASIILVITRHPTALQWGYVYLITTFAVATVSYVLVCAKLGAPSLRFQRSFEEIREGFYFSVTLSAQTIYNDIDKTMLARLSTLAATGIYGAAYRIVDASFAPVSALLAAAYPNVFRRGIAGITGSCKYAGELLRHALPYSFLAGSALFICAGLLPIFLGHEYALTVQALRWLAPLPILKTLHYFLSDALTGAGYQGIRSALQAGVAVFNVLINLWLIPAYSWRGAAWSSLASDGLLALSVALAVSILAVRQREVVGLQSNPTIS